MADVKIASLTENTSPTDTNIMIIEDNSDTKKITFANIKASLKTYLDTLYPPKESPTFTGVPLSPTASVGTNTNQIASTKFVQQEIDVHKAVSANKHITETGTNANGKYIKFDDGTMICTIKKEATYNDASRLYLWSVFPVGFVEPPVTIASCSELGNFAGGMPNVKSVIVGNIQTNNGDFWVNSISSNLVAGNKAMLHIILMGRWK